jgi:hypothetical protein
MKWIMMMYGKHNSNNNQKRKGSDMKKTHFLFMLIASAILTSGTSAMANDALLKTVSVVKLVAKSPFIIAGGTCGLISQSVKGELSAFTHTKELVKERLGAE